VRRDDLGWLLRAVRLGESPSRPPHGSSLDLLEALERAGAQFRAELAASSGRLPAEVDEGLWDLVARGIVTADGAEREVDAIVLGTGFHVTDMPVAEWIRGRAGLTLAEVWRGSPQAHVGTTVAGFPNLFMLVGPNTGLGHNSIVFMIESQLNYVLDCLRYMDRADVAAVDVREDVQERFNTDVQRRLKGSVWTSGGCVSWYLDEHGRNTTIWPGSTWPYRRLLRRFRPDEYELRPRRPARPAPVAPTPGSEPMLAA